MRVKVKRGYVLFVGNKHFNGNDIAEVDDKTYKTQAWKVEVIDPEIVTDRMMKSEKVSRKKKS